jgi:hypothetical protein
MGRSLRGGGGGDCEMEGRPVPAEIRAFVPGDMGTGPLGGEGKGSLRWR